MIRSRFNPNVQSREEKRNTQPALLELAGSYPTPAAWVEEAARLLGGGAFALLVGGADAVGFRLRVAQGQARADALPGCFDHAALLVRPDDGLDFLVFHVPLRSLEVTSMTSRNAVEETSLTFLSDGFQRFPNLALINFPVENPRELKDSAEALRGARLSDDFVSPLVRWLGFIWGCEDSRNPLSAAVGVPSAMFLESCYAAARQDISPGIQERVVTPEAIWQAARWWPEYYRKDPQSTQPLGYYLLGQRAAQASWPSQQGSV